MPTTLPLPELSVSAHGFAFVARFKAEQDIRHYLNGVRLEPHPAGGVMIVATNGHQLAAFHDAAGVCGREIILATPRALLAACGHRDADRLAVVGGRLIVQDHAPGGQSTIFEHAQFLERYVGPGHLEIEGKFPEWRRLFPKAEQLVPGAVGTLQARYVAKACEAGDWLATRLHRRRGICDVTHWSENVDRGKVFHRFGGIDHAVVLTMPLRYDPGLGPVPSFVTLKPEA